MPCVICDAWVLKFGDIIWERVRDTWQVRLDVFVKGYHRGEDLWLAYCPTCWCTRRVRILDTQSLLRPDREIEWDVMTHVGDDVGDALGED